MGSVKKIKIKKEKVKKSTFSFRPLLTGRKLKN